MKRRIPRRIICFVVCVLTITSSIGGAFAAEVQDDPVSAVIAQLEAIDTLQQIQNKRSSYIANAGHYDVNTTDTAIITAHTTARSGYEAYSASMFAARAAAQQSYDALTGAQKAQISPDLVAKLNNELPTVFSYKTYSVTPRDDAYMFEAVGGADSPGLGYEVSNHMVAGEIPQTFVLVDTSDGKTSWTPDGKYVYGANNYEVAYCSDADTPLSYSSHYKRINLEDSGYYNEGSAEHIRSILMNAYPYLSLEEMKQNLKAGGLSSDFVDSLTRSDIISAVQLSVWTYSNRDIVNRPNFGYFASVDITQNTGIYFTPIHDTNNECWDWLPKKRQRSYDPRAEYRVEALAYYLCNLEGTPLTDESQMILSDVEVTRAALTAGADGTYRLGMDVYLNTGGAVDDDLTITVTTMNSAGTITAKTAQKVAGRTEIPLTVKANNGDTIEVVVEGTQTLGKGVYFYEPEGGRESSQCLVGVAEGETNVRAAERFTFEEKVSEMGLRIHKTAVGTGKPLEGIVFDIYNVQPAAGTALNETPTQEELAIYQTEENKIASLTTDKAGYASVELDEGIYLVVEQFDETRIKAPVDPFYVYLPMKEQVEQEDGTIMEITHEIVSIYPKNEPFEPPTPPPPPPPPPDSSEGLFEILKVDGSDHSVCLEGAMFEVYRAASSAEEATKTLEVDGVQYAVVPVLSGDSPLVLTTGKDGRAVSPTLPCGLYFVVESKSPDGYNLMDKPCSVMVLPNVLNSQSALEIENEKGNILPETGGIGTKIFLVVGGILMIAAVVLLVTRRRMDRYQ